MSEYKDGRGDYYLAEGLREQVDKDAAIALARAMAYAGYADPDPVEQWALPDGDEVAAKMLTMGYMIVKIEDSTEIADHQLDNGNDHKDNEQGEERPTD